MRAAQRRLRPFQQNGIFIVQHQSRLWNLFIRKTRHSPEVVIFFYVKWVLRKSGSTQDSNNNEISINFVHIFSVVSKFLCVTETVNGSSELKWIKQPLQTYIRTRRQKVFMGQCATVKKIVYIIYVYISFQGFFLLKYCMFYSYNRYIQ